MPVYAYTALDAGGRTKKGGIEAVKLRMPVTSIAGVRLREISFVVERETAQTAS